MAKKPPWSCGLGLQLRWLLVLALTVLSFHAAGNTFPSDKAALLDFKAGLHNDQGLLTTWNSTTDPCEDGWHFVSCNCNDTIPPISGSDCAAAEGDVSNRRVLMLSLGNVITTKGRQLYGPLSPGLGNLTELRTLDAHDNHLSGTIPAALAGLGKISQFVLNGNELSGSIPAYLGSFPGLREAWVARNNLSGPLSPELCNGSVSETNLHLQNNGLLCGPVPACLSGHVPNLNGTGLFDPQDVTSNPGGGLCDKSPPSCVAQNGCRVLTPRYWTNVSSFSFNFTSFADSGTGIRGYEWGLDSDINGTNVVDFRPFDGTIMSPATVDIGGGSFSNATLYMQSISFHYQTLVNGQRYIVLVRATNNGAQRLNATASSDSVEVDITPPHMEQSGQVYNAPTCTMALTQAQTDTLWACWDKFVDEQTPVVQQYYQVFQDEPQGSSGQPITAPTNISLQSTSTVVTGLQLQYGESYYVVISAVNAAGLVGTAKSQDVAIEHESENLPPAKVAGIVLAAVLGTGAAVAALTIWITRHRSDKTRMRRKKVRIQNEQMKAMMSSLMTHKGEGAANSIDQLVHAHELAFVMTDMEGSTAQASANPAAYAKIQQVHDMVMREGIRMHNGYEINTEGDSFHIAFLDIVEAINFCMEIQYRLLLETPWSKAILKMPFCKEVTSVDGDLVFRGPRLRMAVHFAVEGTIAHRLHQLTKHRVFTGPGFQVAAELGEAANGGQVLLSHDAWLRLQGRMHEASFPVVEQLGSYKLNAWPVPLPVYQIKRLALRPLPRSFGPLRKIELDQPGAGFLITCPPNLTSSKVLTFAALQLTLTEAQKEHLSAPVVTTRRLGVSTHSIGKARSALSMAPATMRQLLDIFFISAQQFQGYVSDVDNEEGKCLVTFASPLNAVRFCHVTQVALMFAKWPADGQHICGPEEHNVEGRLLFAGPRVAMALHSSADYTFDIDPGHDNGQRRVAFSGDGVSLTEDLAACANGGQVVLSEAGWAAVQEQLPGACQAISLGVHCISDAFPEAMLLMEVLPSLLAARNFPRLASARMLELGYRDSPDPSAVAIVFVMPAKPGVVATAESSAQEVSADMVDIMEAYNVALGRYVRLVRDTLPLYCGYECKEPEPGKFTLAFTSLEKAVRWCVAAQYALLDIQWPEALLKLPDCAPETDPSTGQLSFRGLRIRMGASFGSGLIRKPLNTGRADYFGTVSNLAARVAGLAAPGQILVEGREAFRRERDWRRQSDAILLLPDPMGGAKGMPGGDTGIELEQIGYYLLKGLEDPQLIFQVVPEGLSGRKFAPPSAGMRVHYLPRRGRFNVASSFVSGTSASGDSGNSSSGHMLPLKLRHLLNLPSQTALKPGTFQRKARARSNADLHSRSQSLGVTEQSAPSELIIYRSPPSGVSPWGSFADSIFRRARSSGAGLPGCSPFHAGGGGALHNRRSSRCSSDAELAFEDPASRDGLPSCVAPRRHSGGVCREDSLVRIALEAPSEDGSGVLASTPSGSLYVDASSPSASARQHSAFARRRPDPSADNRNGNSSGADDGARGAASGMLARMAVARLGNGLGRSWSAADRPSPLSESSGAFPGAAGGTGMHGSVSAPTPEPYPDRWRTNPIADEGQASSSRSESFSNQDNGRPELHAENAAYAREVAELFASSRRGIERASLGAASTGMRTTSGGSGAAAARSGSGAGSVLPPAADSNSTSSSSIRRQQDRSSSTPAGTRREDMLPIDSSTGPRSRSLAAIEGEAQSFGGRRRSISWRDRAGVALTEEDSQGMVSRERSSHGFLPDVHEEMEMSEDQLGAHINSRASSLGE